MTATFIILCNIYNSEESDKLSWVHSGMYILIVNKYYKKIKKIIPILQKK